MRSATNFIFFKVVWALSLVGVSIGSPWLGAAGLCLFIIWHSRTSTHAPADFLLAAFAVVLGTLIDTVNIHTNVLVYEEAWPSEKLAPFWIMVLWANFALLMNGGLRWLQGKYLLAAAIGAFVGPLGYILGVRLGTASYASTKFEFALVTGTAWAIALPLLLFLAGYLRKNLQRSLA